MYVGNNLIRIIDPTGEDWIDILKGIAKGAGKAITSAVTASPAGIAVDAYNLSQAPTEMQNAVGMAILQDFHNKSVPGFVDHAVKKYKSGGDGSKTGELAGGIIAEAAIAAGTSLAGSAGTSTSVSKNMQNATNSINKGAEGITGFRYVSEGEIGAINKTGMLRGGKPGETYFTKDLYKSASKAQQRLALPSTPTHRVEFKITNNPVLILILNGSKVTPMYNMPGKGSEFMTTSPVHSSIINYQKLNK